MFTLNIGPYLVYIYDQLKKKLPSGFSLQRNDIISFGQFEKVIGIEGILEETQSGGWETTVFSSLGAQ